MNMKFLKKYKFIMGLTTMLVVVTSCSELSPEDPNNFQDFEVDDADLFAVGMYQAYQKIPANEYLITELRSDNAVSDSGNGDLGNAESYNLNAFSDSNILITNFTESNQFGNSSDDTHTFTGAITASGDISASGAIIASTLTGTINGGTF